MIRVDVSGTATTLERYVSILGTISRALRVFFKKQDSIPYLLKYTFHRID